jgi:acetyl-CoA acetyltransferase family protein
MRRALFITGVRTPFALSGTSLSSFRAVDLAKMALKGLIDKTALDSSALSLISLGNVIQDVNTANVAREAALMAGIPTSVPCHTMTMACISSNASIAHASTLIEAGRASLAIVGGVDIMSDAPIRYSKALRQRMLASTKVKGGLLGYASLLQGLTLSDLSPETPTISEFSTGESMGHSADRLASRWGVTRSEQDNFALRSHENAALAHANGHLRNDLINVPSSSSLTKSAASTSESKGGKFSTGSSSLSLSDNGIKIGSTIDKLSSLKPSFVKPHGTVTAGNSSFLTDGASACLIASEKSAKEHGLIAKSQIVDWIFTGSDPKEELLLGPAYAIAELLERNNLSVSDICVWELHEAFAGQVLANLNALDSDIFVKQREGTSRSGGSVLGSEGGSKKKFGKIGRVPMHQINTWGGSLALGHPFGATGGRLLTMASNRLGVEAEGHGFAILAACAAGGQGHAMLIRGIPSSLTPGPKNINV